MCSCVLVLCDSVVFCVLCLIFFFVRARSLGLSVLEFVVFMSSGELVLFLFLMYESLFLLVCCIFLDSSPGPFHEFHL